MPDDIHQLEDKITAARQAAAAAEHRGDSAEEERQRKQMSAGMQAGTEFITYVIAGGIVGFFADKFLGTLPLFLLVFIFSGFGYGIFRAARLMK